MHPLTVYALATQRIADDQRLAQQERIARQAREGRVANAARAPFHDRLRLLIDRSRRYRTTVPLAALTLIATTLSFGAASAADSANDPAVISRFRENLTVGGYPVPTPDVSFGKIRVPLAGGLPAPASGAGPSFAEYQAFLLRRHADGLVPTFKQRQAFLMEEHGYTSSPTLQQHQSFLMEEHGYTSSPTLRQRQAFLMEEHGYTTGAR